MLLTRRLQPLRYLRGLKPKIEIVTDHRVEGLFHPDSWAPANSTKAKPRSFDSHSPALRDRASPRMTPSESFSWPLCILVVNRDRDGTSPVSTEWFLLAASRLPGL